MANTKKTQRKKAQPKKEPEKKKGIKIPSWFIVGFVVFALTFLGRIGETDNSMPDYMNQKYVPSDVQPDPFEKPPEVPTAGGGGQPDPNQNLNDFMNEFIFSRWFWVMFIGFNIIIVIPFITRMMRY